MHVSAGFPLQFFRRAFLDGSPPWPWQVVLFVVAVISLSVLYRIADPAGRWARRARSRLLLGVPWGTLLGVLFLLVVYLFVQGAYSGDVFDPRSPVTYAFIATSFDYPTGILTAAFAHQGFGHFLGNAIGLLVFGTICEYSIGHFPTERGAQAERSWRGSPYARPLAMFTALVGAGLFTAVFTPGPVIGFSGVIFALAGFALLVRPLTAVGGLLVASVLGNLFNTFSNPVASFRPSFGQTGGAWFAGVSVTGHFLGFLLGVVLAIAFLRWTRTERPSSGRIYVGVFVYAMLQQLWLVYWAAGNGEFVLFRAAGVSVVLLLTAVVVLAVSDVSRPALPWPSTFSASLREETPSRSVTAATVLVTGLLALSLAGVALNTTTFEGTDLPNDPVEVRGYQVGYTENTTNQLYSVDVPVVDLPALENQNVESSGVIVMNERRHVWQVETTTQRLAQTGVSRVRVGGVGWRETVWVTRTSWSVIGGGQAYRVQLYPPDGGSRLAFTSEPATAEAVIANRSISLRPSGTDFEIVVTRDNETMGAAGLPSKGSNATLAGLRFEREKKNLYASYDGTRVRIAKKRVPPARRN